MTREDRRTGTKICPSVTLPTANTRRSDWKRIRASAVTDRQTTVDPCSSLNAASIKTAYLSPPSSGQNLSSLKMHLFLADNLIPFSAAVKRQAGKGEAQSTQLQTFSFHFEKRKCNLQKILVAFKKRSEVEVRFGVFIVLLTVLAG